MFFHGVEYREAVGALVNRRYDVAWQGDWMCVVVPYLGE